MSAEKVIDVEKLCKSFGALEVLRDVSFGLEKGQILALLGPNGAGKTTTVKILATLLKPNSGSATVLGHTLQKDDDKIRAQIGLTGQFAAVDEYLTGRENIEMIARLYHMERSGIKDRTQELLERFDLSDAGDRTVKTYSGGMKRRLDLAMSLVASPPILFLDEPTTGLDPRSRLTLWEMVRALAEDGTTILLTTQYMEEAEYLADDVIVLDNGSIIAEGTVNQLKTKAGDARVEVTMKSDKDIEAAKKILEKLSKNVRHTKATGLLTVPAKNGTDSLTDLIKALETAKLDIDTIGLRKPTLDDVFLALTGHKAEHKEAVADKKGKKR